jgi:hypothetical protein
MVLMNPISLTNQRVPTVQIAPRIRSDFGERELFDKANIYGLKEINWIFKARLFVIVYKRLLEKNCSKYRP